jgi:curved DNA-binding protein CbpA
VKVAWRKLQKAVHPDLAGEYAAAAAALVNEAYEVLSSDANRSAFDADREDWLRWGRGGENAADLSLMDSTPLSRWSGPVTDQSESGEGGEGGRLLEAVFVDESHCIGCLKCALLAPKTFFIETRWGCTS